MAPSKIRFFFEWQCTPFWSGNDDTTKRFGYSIQPENLPLSPEIINSSYELANWHDGALNKDYPPDPSPWRQEECDRFNAAVNQLFASISAELGEDFELVYQQNELQEDPDLDEYLNNPKKFNRLSKG